MSSAVKDFRDRQLVARPIILTHSMKTVAADYDSNEFLNGRGEKKSLPLFWLCNPFVLGVTLRF